MNEQRRYVQRLLPENGADSLAREARSTWDSPPRTMQTKHTPKTARPVDRSAAGRDERRTALLNIEANVHYHSPHELGHPRRSGCWCEGDLSTGKNLDIRPPDHSPSSRRHTRNVRRIRAQRVLRTSGGWGYCVRSASTGSTEAARRAGMNEAASAIRRIDTAAKAMTTGSSEST
jgi:hypothetical protein